MELNGLFALSGFREDLQGVLMDLFKLFWESCQSIFRAIFQGKINLETLLEIRKVLKMPEVLEILAKSLIKKTWPNFVPIHLRRGGLLSP